MARIVLIDDETRLLRTLARFLEQSGHETVTASGFAEVEHELWPGRFDVLITDIIMPEVDGLEVLREVVERRGCAEPVLLITGEPNIESAAEAVRLHAFDYISKPVTKDKLLHAVTRAQRHVVLVRERDRARRKELDVLRSLALLGEQASVLSHEIRTPIGALRQALRAVADKLGIEDRVLVEELVANIARIERLLGETLSFARPVDLSLSSVGVGALISDAVDQARRLPLLRDLEVAVECPEELPPIACDAQLCAEVLINLIRNAAEALRDVGKGASGHIGVAASAHEGGVTLDVTDDGPGVGPDHREEIFEPFHSSKDGGTGIGLAFCRKIIEAHGGSIELVDRSEPGACFRVLLPRSQ